MATTKILSSREFHSFSLHKSLIYAWKNAFYLFICILLSVFENLNARLLKAGALFILLTTIPRGMANHDGLRPSFAGCGVFITTTKNVLRKTGMR